MGFWKSWFNPSGSTLTNGLSPLDTPDKTGLNQFTGQILREQVIGNSRICFTTDRDIDLFELEELCDAVGWARRPLRKVKKAIQFSFLVVSMWELRGSKRRLIGFSRATSDHAFNATIWDVVIHPDFQGKGLGKTLMQQIIKKLRSEDISNITLFADAHVVDFYQRLGFLSDPEGIKGMFWYPD
ncbi:MAG: GNAT family N-acetyltransferase [Synechococcales bacterium]|jgi:GNAT superfamily N-acetyltransferase|nr:GNAT family N-acetyltransferase [Cyanobacteria bacterium REEB444]MEB3125337.1 GNAT family N-acetyltransferase [Synechococcales bacterium]NBO32012.1 GNAT family N-acetyltransferase [Cyanobacteria bacterium WB6_1B_304]